MKSINRIVALAIVIAGLMVFTSVLGASFSTDGMDRVSSNNHVDKGRRSRSNRNSNNNSNSNANGNRNQNSNENSNSNGNSSIGPTGSGISVEQARQIALENVPGTVIKEERKYRRGRSVYEFYIRKSNGDMFEVKIDVSDGRVVEIESKD